MQKESGSGVDPFSASRGVHSLSGKVNKHNTEPASLPTCMELRPISAGRPLLPGELFPLGGHKTLEPGTRVDVLMSETNTVVAGTVSQVDCIGETDRCVLLDSGESLRIIPGKTQFAIRDYSGFESTLPALETGSEIDALDSCGTQCHQTGMRVRHSLSLCVADYAHRRILARCEGAAT